MKGLAYKENGASQVNMERPFIQDLDRFRPQWEKIDCERYLIPSGSYKRAIPVYISRGCPFPLRVLLQRSGDEAHVAATLDRFITNQIQWLKDHYRIDAIDYADDYLFGRIKPMQRWSKKLGMPWSGQVRVQLLTTEFVQWMNATGCQWVNIGAGVWIAGGVG